MVHTVTTSVLNIRSLLMISNQYSANISDPRLYATRIAYVTSCAASPSNITWQYNKMFARPSSMLLLTDLCELQMCSKCGPHRRRPYTYTNCTPHSCKANSMVDPYCCLQYVSKFDRPNFSKIPSLTSVTEYCDTDTNTNSTSSCNCWQDTAGLRLQLAKNFEPAFCDNAHLF
jgi:hypothetical protein